MRPVTGEKTSDLRRELVLSAEEDHMDLATVADIVKDALGLTEERDVYAHTIRTLRRLLEDGFLRAGIPTLEGGFDPWEGGPKEVMSRIEHGWSALSRRPTLGEIVWFDTTERGLAYLGHPGNRN